MIGENRRYPKIHREIINAVIELEKFIRLNQHLQIIRSDKGKKTIIMLKSTFKQMKAIFMEKAVNSGLYKWEGEATKERIEYINTSEMDKLRRKIKIWKIKGIFKDKTKYNMQMETKLWEIANNIEGIIPTMQFLIKTHKPEGLQLRNICPKNKACTYQISIILMNILEEALKASWENMEYMDTNIYNSVNFAEDLQNRVLQENEEITIFDIKEMFNAINTEKLIDIITRHINNTTYNRETIISMLVYDIKEANWIINDGNLYKQNKGIPMGSPTSTMYAKIFTDYFIMINWNELKNNGMKNIYKYIDDILIIHEKGHCEKIKNIMEKELELEMKMNAKEKELEYLDFKIHMQQGGKLLTQWNKKDFVSNRIIHSCSQINHQIKEATLINRIIRTARITSEDFLYDCTQTNIEEFLNNGYNAKQIKEIIIKAIRKIRNMNNQNTTNKIKQLEECIATLNLKIKKEQIARNLKELNKKNWKQMYGKIKCRKTTRKAKLKGILKRKHTQRKGIGKYIRIPHNIGKTNVQRSIKQIFKDNIHTVYTTRKDKKLDTIIKQQEINSKKAKK